MKVILLKDVKGIGRAGELITTSDGHAMNLLLPKKLAVQATPQALAKHKARAAYELKEIEQLTALAKQLAAEPIIFKLKTGTHGEVFSSVTKEDILAAVSKKGVVEIKIDLDKPIRTLGLHHATLHLGHGIETKITIEVTGDK